MSEGNEVEMKTPAGCLGMRQPAYLPGKGGHGLENCNITSRSILPSLASKPKKRLSECRAPLGHGPPGPSVTYQLYAAIKI